MSALRSIRCSGRDVSSVPRAGAPFASAAKESSTSAPTDEKRVIVAVGSGARRVQTGVGSLPATKTTVEKVWRCVFCRHMHAGLACM